MSSSEADLSGPQNFFGYIPDPLDEDDDDRVDNGGLIFLPRWLAFARTASQSTMHYRLTSDLLSERLMRMNCLRALNTNAEHAMLRAILGMMPVERAYVHVEIGIIYAGRVLAWHVHAGRVLALLQKNVKERTCRPMIVSKIMQSVLGSSGPDRLIALLPYMNGYTLRRARTF